MIVAQDPGNPPFGQPNDDSFRERADKAPRRLRPDQHFFWVESALLDPSLKTRISKAAWLAYLLFCRRASPAAASNQVEISASFSGANDIVNTLGFTRAVALDAIEELKKSSFITPAPWIAPPTSHHLLKGRGHEVKLVPQFVPDFGAFMANPNPRTIDTVKPIPGFPREHIFLPSKLFDEGLLKRCQRNWDLLRLLLHIYNLQDLAMCSGLPIGILRASPANPNIRNVEMGEVDNEDLIGKRIHYFDDFNEMGFEDHSRYSLDPCLYTPIAIERADCLRYLVMLRQFNLVRWKFVVIEQDDDDPRLSTLAYEAGPSSVPWLDPGPCRVAYVEDIKCSGMKEDATFILCTYHQANTLPTVAYRTRIRSDKATLKDLGEAPDI